MPEPPKVTNVQIDTKKWTCSCEDFQAHKACWHIGVIWREAIKALVQWEREG